MISRNVKSKQTKPQFVGDMAEINRKMGMPKETYIRYGRIDRISCILNLILLIVDCRSAEPD